jgi:uncharacterized protein YgiM (DUF1202 family)
LLIKNKLLKCLDLIKYLQIMNNLRATNIFFKIFVITSIPFASPALSQSSSCQLQAFVADQDSVGLNVRRYPNSRSQILGKLPRNTEIRASKVQGNWMLISPISPETQNVEFQGQGWVSASFLGLGTRGYGQKTVTIYRQASLTSRTAGNIPSGRSVKLLSCKGSWAQIEKNGSIGWLPYKDQCASPLTSCS